MHFQAPTPKATIGVDVRVPVPGEQEATNFAISNGKVIALVVVVLAVYVGFRWLLRSWQVRIVLALVVGFVAAVFLGNRGVV